MMTDKKLDWLQLYLKMENQTFYTDLKDTVVHNTEVISSNTKKLEDHVV